MRPVRPDRDRRPTHAAALGRPTALPVPSFGPKLLLGSELAETLLQASHRVRPAALEASGFRFGHPDVTEAFRSLLLGSPGKA